MVEGYSHGLSSCGFWPGGGDEGAFYAYAYPEPAGYEAAAEHGGWDRAALEDDPARRGSPR